MGEQLYSIGNVSKLTGISVQALRHYDSIDLVKPSYINEQTGYRYYSYNQLHIVDRIKYLRKLGFSLGEIEKALKSGRTEDLLICLESKENELSKEMERLRENIETIQWYKEYYNYLIKNDFSGIPYKRKLSARYVLAVDCYENEPVRASGPLRLAKAKNTNEFREEDYLRQNGYILDFEALISHKVKPKKYFVYLKHKPRAVSEYVMEFPEGEYLCFRGRLLINDYDTSYIKNLFEDRKTPAFAIADEYEDNLKSFTHCVYEIQIRI